MRPFLYAFVFSGAQLFAVPDPVLVDLFSTVSFTDSSSASGTTISITNTSELLFVDQSTAGDALISIDGTSELNFAQTSASVYTGVLSGTGTVIKSGSGDLALNGNNSGFMGTLLLNQGTLFLNGAFGGDVQTSPNTLIVYGGPISGNLVVSQGTITTSGFSTLNVGGNYTQSNGAVYIANLNSQGQTSLIDVAGTATITGGLVQANTSGGFLYNHLYNILHAGGGVIGTYGLIPTPGLSIFITYDAQNVYLSFSPNFGAIARTPNQIQVANQLNHLINLSPDESFMLASLVSLPPDQMRHALDLMSGEQYTAFILSALYQDERFSRRIFNACRYFLNPCAPSCAEFQPWIFAGGGKGFQKGNSNAFGFESSNYDISLGFQSAFGKSWLLGAAAEYENDSIDSRLAGNASFHTVQGALYSDFKSKRFYIHTDLIGAGSGSDFGRPIAFGEIHRKAKGKPRISHGRLDFEIGYNGEWCPHVLQPFIGGSALLFHQSRFQENGASSLDLVVGSQTKWLGSTLAGIHFNTHVFDRLSIDLDLAWEHYYGNLQVVETMRFVQFGTNFPIIGPERGHDGGIGSFAIAAPFGECWHFYAQGSGEIWKDWHAYSVNGGLVFSW